MVITHLLNMMIKTSRTGFSAVILTAVLLLAGCSSNDVKVSGRFVGYDNRPVYLERVMPSSQSVIDSAMSDGQGYFRFNVKLPQATPIVYNIWCGADAVPLMLEPGDKVKLYAVGSIPNYTVEGSESSIRMRELKNILSGGASRLDSILTLHGSADDAGRQKLWADYNREYFRTKREHLEFIVSDPGSMASLYALYQRLPGDPVLFDEESDFVYYKLVADSAGTRYPDSPYVKALRNEINSAESEFGLTGMVNEKLAGQRSGFPEVIMSDMYGKQHRLSSHEGKVILLDFTSIALPDYRLVNAEYKELYGRHADEGFEIYQVSLDTDKPAWITSVQDQKLPWISVCDLNGAKGVAVRTYNVHKVPSNFLIDRNGDIIAKDIYGDKLDKRVGQLVAAAKTAQ